MSPRRQAILVMSLLIIAALVAGWMARRRQPQPKPASDLEVAAAWLQCIDCEGSFLQRLDNLPAENTDTVTKFLRSALLNGPDSLQLRRSEGDLRQTWERDSVRRARRGESPRSDTLRVAFFNRYRQGFTVRLRSRAAVGLGVIGSPLAQETLDSALKISPVTGADSTVYRMVQRAADSAAVAVAVRTVTPPDPDTLPYGDVAGTVINEAGRRLSGASLVVEGTSIAAATRPDGQYRLTHIPAGTRVLRARMIGHRPERVSITVTGGGHIRRDFRLRRLPDSLAVVP